jgi:Transcriptional regulator/sugar kinase
MPNMMNNKFLLIKAIAQTEDINRTLLAQKLEISEAAVSKLISPLLQHGYIAETSYFSKKRQRKARFLSIAKNRFCVLVIRIVRKGVYSALIDVSGTVTNMNFEACRMEEFNETLMINCAVAMARQIPSGMTCLCAVIVHPGIVFDDPQNPSIKKYEHVPIFWNFFRVAEKIKEITGLKTFYENDCNCALIGEVWFGACREVETAVLYNIGIGIGAAAYSHGILQRRIQ